MIDGVDNGGKTAKGLLSSDLAMRIFAPVKNKAGEVILYMASIDNKAQFDHVCELVSACLSFRLECEVSKSDRENLKAVARTTFIHLDN